MSAVRLPGLLLLAGVGGMMTGCATRPGYVDCTTGRAYAGFAKPACYATDFCGLCGLKECDRGRDPYRPPVEAFTSFPGLQAGCSHRRPQYHTTHVYAPMPAGYEQFAGSARRFDGPGSAPPRTPSTRNEANPLSAPMPLPASTQPPGDGPIGGPGLPPTSPAGIGE
ncbi:hypothetical protein [Alienimonas chondri]|nr:hypothetical protein [Alienimonas chondri]